VPLFFKEIVRRQQLYLEHYIQVAPPSFAAAGRIPHRTFFHHVHDEKFKGGLIAKDAVIWVRRAKNLIHGGKQNAADSVQTGGGTLSSANTVINKNINCSELATMGVVQMGVMMLLQMQGRAGKRRRQRGTGTVDRYRCVVFPGKWKRLRVSRYRSMVFLGALVT
jgi:hypothetical protein